MHELKQGYQYRFKVAVASATMIMMIIGSTARWSQFLLVERVIAVRLTPYTDMMRIDPMAPETEEVTPEPIAPPEEPVEEKPPDQMQEIVPVPDWVEIEEKLAEMPITQVAQVAAAGSPGGTGRAATGNPATTAPEVAPGPAYDERPRVLKKVDPEYPLLAKMTGVEGMVVLLILIDASGNVEEIEVVKSLGNTGCDEAAVKAIKQWRFAPAMRQGRPIAARVTMPVLFNLKTAQ